MRSNALWHRIGSVVLFHMLLLQVPLTRSEVLLLRKRQVLEVGSPVPSGPSERLELDMGYTEFCGWLSRVLDSAFAA